MGCGCGDGDDVIKTAGRNSSNKLKEREGEEGGGDASTTKVNQSGPDKSIGTLLNAVNHFSSCM